MTENEFKEYIESIKHTYEFQQLMEWIGIEDDQKLFESLLNYLSKAHPRRDTREFFVPDFNHFREFFDCYRTKSFEMFYTQTGEIDLSKTPYIKQSYNKKSPMGKFTDRYIMLPDRTIFISKYPVHLKPKWRIYDSACQYNGIIATGIANQIGVSSSENELAIIENGQPRLLSKFFLLPNEELNSFYEDEEDENEKINTKISDTLNSLESSLRLRKFPETDIKRAKIEFLKQEFLAKLIGLCDQNNQNTGIITSTDSESNRSVRLAPMFDYDFSFFTAKDFLLTRRACDNGQTDIGSLIRQYKDYPGFMEFVKKSISTLDMNQVYDSIYTSKHLKLFKPPHDDVILNRFTEFVNRNLTLARNTVKELNENAKEEK